MEAAVSASTFTVSDPADDGLGTLRQAIASANSGDTVDFAPTLAGQVIGLTGGSIRVESDIVIDASSAPGIEVSGNDLDRVFVIASSVDVEIRGLTITHGFSSDFDGGGAIDNQGSLTLLDCSIKGSSALYGGAIDTDGSLSLVRCEILNNHSTDGGGAFYNLYGILTITDSTIANNQSAFDGGAIVNEDGMLTVENSTIADNRADGDGGGVISTGFSAAATCTCIHSTITGNVAGGLGGGIRIADGTCHLENGIVADNQGSGDPDISKESITSSPTLTASGGNLIGDNTSATTEFPGGATVGTAALPLRSFLAPLAHYGSGQPTRPPLPGSPAISNALTTSNSPPADQHGVTRPVRALPDLGAVETFLWKDLPAIDNDSDGFDDRIEPFYNHVVGVNDSLADSDGDGQLDVLEIDSMTNPLDADSLLAMESFELLDPTTRTFRIQFTSFPGLDYAAEADQTLTFSGPDITILGSGSAVGFLSEISGVLRPERDFVRLVRE